MAGVATMLPSRRSELVVRPLGDRGQHVVKDPRTGAYYNLGEQESFLLLQLDGRQSGEAVCTAFARRFGQPLTEDELHEFVELAEKWHLLQPPAAPPPPALADRPPAAVAPQPTFSAWLATTAACAAAPPELVAPRPDYPVWSATTGACAATPPEPAAPQPAISGWVVTLDAWAARTPEPVAPPPAFPAWVVLLGAGVARPSQPVAPQFAFSAWVETRGAGAARPPEPVASQAAPAAAPAAPPRARQSILYWRKSLFDPDRFFTWLEPNIRFVWTWAFLFVSAGCIAAAAALVWVERQALASHLPHALTWETALLVWLTVLAVTFLHEFAHGLTCKRYGGEVHEVGFLLLYFMPCFYCNVSDAWLFKEKWKRLLVMLAGSYCDLCVWAVAVFVWRLTAADTFLNHLAWVVLSVCGFRVFLNFNPLLKLDGYYLLSDWLEIPNLRQRSWALVAAHLRRLLWGAPRPRPEPRARVLLTYGLVSWLFSMTYLVLMFVGLVHFFGASLGVLGVAGAALFGLLVSRRMFEGISEGEVSKMIRKRHGRAAAWALALGAVPALLYFVQIEDRAGGQFQVRPAQRAEVRAPVSGFLRAVHAEEGDRLSLGAPVAQLEVPDLASRIVQKRAEVEEIQAKLYLLEAGPRPVEVAEQRQKVERAQAWRDLAQQDLERAHKTLQEDLSRLEEQITQGRSELSYARYAVGRDEKLLVEKAVSMDQYKEKKKQLEVAHAHLDQVSAQKRARQSQGTQEAETELARRQKELADAQATLTLLLAGTRPEEIDAERARLARVREEARYLEGLQEKLPLFSPVPGVVTTPRLREKVGQYFKEGELICTVEEPAVLEVEITVSEQELARVRLGQPVELKVRALPFETFHAEVSRIAPSALRPGAETVGAGHTPDPQAQANVTVYCQLDNAGGALRPGMTGYARIYCGPQPVGWILLERTLRYFRTEFWW